MLVAVHDTALERYRNQIIKEISKKVSLIQNEGLEEHRVRDLNDAINKLMREKGHWERQIKVPPPRAYGRIIALSGPLCACWLAAPPRKTPPPPTCFCSGGRRSAARTTFEQRPSSSTKRTRRRRAC
eukprot:6206290-Pleurochrysis_carterae.AAC.2